MAVDEGGPVASGTPAGCLRTPDTLTGGREHGDGDGLGVAHDVRQLMSLADQVPGAFDLVIRPALAFQFFGQ